MKGISRKIALSVLALVLTLAATLTGAYAWFVINNTAEVKGLQGTVQSGDGGFIIQAASSYENGTTTFNNQWTTSLNLSETLKKVGSGEDDRFAALSWNPSTDVNKRGFYGWDVTTGSNGNQKANGGWIEFDLAIATSDTFNFVNIASITISPVAGESEWAYEVDGFTETEITANGITFKGNAADAARVGFFQNNVATAVAQVANKTVDTDFTFGKVTGEGEEAVISGNKAISDYNHFAKDSKITAASLTAANDTYLQGNVNTGLNSKHVADLNTPTEENPLTNAIVLPEGYKKYAVVTVRIWIEGWDQEAFNFILKDSLKVEFVLKGSAQ